MKKIRTLIADDHIIVRAGIRQFLQSAPDIEVVAEAEDGEQAKTLIQAERPEVAVLDIQMPKATGIEVTRWAKTNAQGVGILILTAYNDDPCELPTYVPFHSMSGLQQMMESLLTRNALK